MSANNAILIPRIESRIQVIRNRERFPADFLFQLTLGEKAEVIANCDHLQKLKFSKTLPFAFTEHGAIQVMTMKVSKGLEFPLVALPTALDGRTKGLQT